MSFEAIQKKYGSVLQSGNIQEINKAITDVTPYAIRPNTKEQAGPFLQKLQARLTTVQDKEQAVKETETVTTAYLDVIRQSLISMGYKSDFSSVETMTSVLKTLIGNYNEMAATWNEMFKGEEKPIGNLQ